MAEQGNSQPAVHRLKQAQLWEQLGHEIAMAGAPGRNRQVMLIKA